MAIPRNLYHHLECLGIKVHDSTLQRWALLGKANILRKVLSVWGHWLDRGNNLRQELQYQRLLWEINDHNNNNNLCTRCSEWYSVTIRPCETSNNQRLRSAGDNDRKVKTLLLQRCALRKFHVRVTVGQNTRDQITSDRRSKRAWSKCVLCIPHIPSGSPSESLPHTGDACVIWGLGLTWGLELRAPLAASSKRRLNRIE